MDIAWDDLKTVLCLVRGGSLAAAASELHVNYTTVARRVARAEAALALPLFERLADGYQATDNGRLIAQHAALMEDQAHALMRQLQRQDGTLRGPLTVTAPQLLIANVLASVIDQFCEAHPDVDLHIRATTKHLDLSRREADLAIRISDDLGDGLTGLCLAPQHAASFATIEVAQRIADDPTAMINWIVYDTYSDLPAGIDPAYPNNRILMTSDDMVAILGAVQASLGIARMPMFLGRSTPDLVQIPVLPPEPYVEIWMVGHPDVWQSAKVAAFRNILVPHFKTTKPMFLA